MKVTVLGIDLAKRVFQLHGADRHGRALHRSKVNRADLLTTVRQLQPEVVAMDACSSAHHWARRFQELGMEVRLISPQYVAPFVKTNKNDRNNAEALVEAACRPSMRFVAIKSVEQQDIQAAHRVRNLLVQQQTAIINQARGLLGERGVIISQSPEAFKRAMPDILAQCAGELTPFCEALLTELLEQISVLDDRIDHAETAIKSFMKASTLCKKIAAIDGSGPITATAVVAAVGDARQFRNGRHLAAWLGLVPKQYSSGGKSRLQGISKKGDTYLRTLLVHGARSVLRYVGNKMDVRSRWLRELIARRGYNRAAVALANKNARVIQVLLTSNTPYQAPA
ncbi:IS110 family transposase [Noviherbaspirillum sp. CPCC 100848]|uniref:IS110 family transposase n=1 Tax=Noviherbaspirillum album TaxID=3080276 RepID=A0ABU6JK04_9BURK|nr:IS110 family transposase [Noviherbaspirillum sp. CPCC 100848]MEC4723537.1 IS110 family transposase [Noviherbaspirillum sp. CPCC 100848]